MWGERRSFSRARAAGAFLVIVLLVFLGGLSSVNAGTGNRCDACRIVQITPRPIPTVVGLPLPTHRPAVTMPPTNTVR